MPPVTTALIVANVAISSPVAGTGTRACRRPPRIRPVSSVMSTDVVTCRAEDAVESLMVSMTERRIRHLPVVDDDGLLGGVISIGDVVKARLGQLETENKQLYDYITQGR